ncbi:MAG: M20 family peptidase [Stagnimonas sp.]|nr:M20 family peptidase [Stagnimonas sp.]
MNRRQRGLAWGRLLLGLLLLVVAVMLWRTTRLRPETAPGPVVAATADAIDAARAAQHLGEAIRFRTITHQDPAEDEVAEWEQLHAWLQQRYPAAHAAMQRELIDGRSLLYTWPGRDTKQPPILLMAHQDVVPVSPGTEGDWTEPPFAGTVKDGWIWGRGSSDDKGSLVALMEAAESLAAAGFQPGRTLLFAFGHNEEVLGSGARAIAEQLKARGLRPEFVLDEGMLVIEDHPVTQGPVALIGIAEKGYATLRLTARAPGGHSSMPPPETAVAVLAQAITAITGSPFPLDYSGPAAEMMAALAPRASFTTRLAVANAWLFEPLLVNQIAATPSGAALLHTTMAPTMLEGSPKENVLPQAAIARINFRIHPRDSAAGVMARVRAAVHELPVELDWEGQPNEPSPVSSTRSPAWQVLAELAAEASGAPVAPALVLGGTDSRVMSGIAQDVYRFMPVRMRLDELGMIHGTNERLSVDNLDRMAEFYRRLIERAAG